MKKVELFEQIRKNYFIDHKKIREIARIYGIHRRQVRQAIKNAVPPQRKPANRNYSVLLLSLRQIIDQWLIEDCNSPSKQRHTGKRVYERLIAEHAYAGTEVTVRNYVYEKRKEFCIPKNIYVPQIHMPGEEAEVDWYEAVVEFPHGRETVYIFQMRACYSGREFHIAFLHQNQQAFLEGHIEAFKYFGGVFNTIRYDNLTAAVKKVLRGRQRIEADRFIALRSHYLFQAVFCLPGIAGSHEKGGVECGVGRFRRSHLVPIPKVSGLVELNQLLLKSCQKDDGRIIIGKTATVAECWQHELDKLIALPMEPFTAMDVVTAKVNNRSLVTAKGNCYSVPVSYVSQEVEVHLQTETISIVKHGNIIAKHPRCYAHHQITAELDHYLPLLKIKPGALTNSVVLQQAKQKWPAIFKNYWEALIIRYGQHDANRQLIDLLWWARDFEITQIEILISKAMELGCYQAESIKGLMRQQTTTTVIEPLAKELLGSLASYDRPKSTTDNYNQLLRGQA